MSNYEVIINGNKIKFLNKASYDAYMAAMAAPKAAKAAEKEASIKITKENYSDQIHLLTTAKERNEFQKKHYKKCFPGQKTEKVWTLTHNGKLWWCLPCQATNQAKKLGVSYSEATGLTKSAAKTEKVEKAKKATTTKAAAPKAKAATSAAEKAQAAITLKEAGFTPAQIAQILG